MTTKTKTKPKVAKKAAAKPKATAKTAKTKQASGPRETKQDMVLAMLRTKTGASADEIMEATGWQEHTARGFISGAVQKKLGLTVEKTKAEGQKIRYRITKVAQIGETHHDT